MKSNCHQENDLYECLTERTEPLLRVVAECHNVHASLHPSGWTSSKIFTILSLLQISAVAKQHFKAFPCYTDLVSCQRSATSSQ